MNVDGLKVKLTMAGLPEDACLEVDLPVETATLRLSNLLDMVFPEEEESRLALQESFDLYENPDLPEIYDYFTRVMEQSRHGLCNLLLSDSTGAFLSLENHAEAYLCPETDKHGGSNNLLSLTLCPEYKALDYALAHGYTAGESDLLAWLQFCTALYFLDKHEHQSTELKDSAEDSPVELAIQQLCHKGLITLSENSDRFEITPQGRQCIGGMLRETESYIDRYDLFKDVVWDEDAECALFNTGHGEDLRAAVFSAEGLDPMRTVFLLRLYDGTPDEFADSWTTLIGDEEFFNSVLEPVVNRSVLPDELLEEILDQGLSLLEATEEEVREGRLIARLGRRISPTYS